MVGVNGIHSANKYKLKTIPDKEFSGYELLAWYYVSWAIAIPEMLDQLDLPFAKAYETALSMYKSGKKNG